METPHTAPSWRDKVPAAVRPYLEKAPLAAFLLGVSSGFPYAMIGATLTTRLAQDGIDKKTVAAFSLAFLVYNFKFLWAPLVDHVRIPGLSRFGQRTAWLWFAGLLVIAAVSVLGSMDPKASLLATAAAAIAVGVAGATFDIVIDAYRIESLEAHQLGVGSGMSQYGWRIGSVTAGSLALLVAQYGGWTLAYACCAFLALPAMLVGWLLGEPPRRQVARATAGRGLLGTFEDAVVTPFTEFMSRHGAWLVLLFVLLHKIGDTLANLTLRILLNDLGFSNDEIAVYDVGVGFFGYLSGIFAGGALYAWIGVERAVLVSLLLMGVSNLGFAILAAVGDSNMVLACTLAFENFASGVGGVVVVAYLSALCNLAYTATQFALLTALASVVGRVLSGTTAGALMQAYGNVNFYLLTTLAAVPGILLYVFMLRAGLVKRSLGRETSGTTVPPGDRDAPSG
jgi:MFS transporter, PAT family, beta-lactamase induction signal transducer AmpG